MHLFMLFFINFSVWNIYKTWKLFFKDPENVYFMAMKTILNSVRQRENYEYILK